MIHHNRHCAGPRFVLLLLQILLVQFTTVESFTPTRTASTQPKKKIAAVKRAYPRKGCGIILHSSKKSFAQGNEKSGSKAQQQRRTFWEVPSIKSSLPTNEPEETATKSLTILLTAQFLLFIGVGAIIPTLPLYGKAIGLPSSANGIVLSAPAIALLILAGPAGRFADRARKPAMIGGMALIAISDIGTATATDVNTLILARLGLGAGRAVSESGERGMIADLAGRMPQARGRALAAQQAVVAFGIAIGAPLGGFVAEEYGLRATFLCVSAAALVALLIYSILEETVSENTPNKRSDEIEQKNFNESWRTLLIDDRWKALALCECGSRFGFAAKISSIPVLAASLLPGGAAGAGALLSAAGLTGLLGAPAGGWLTDRVGARTVAIAGGLLGASAFCLIPLALSFLTDIPPGTEGALLVGGMDSKAVVFSILVLSWSLGASAQGPALTALAQELAPPGEEATALALPRAAGDGTYIVAPFLLGLVADAAPLGTECAVAGAMAVLGVLALSLLGSGSPTSQGSPQ